MNVTEECNADESSRYLQLVGVLQWAVELGQHGIYIQVALLSQHLALPWVGHLEAVYHIFSYLHKHDRSWISFDLTDLSLTYQQQQNQTGHCSMKLHRMNCRCICLNHWDIQSIFTHLWMQTMLVTFWRDNHTMVFFSLYRSHPFYGSVVDKTQWRLQHLAVNLLPFKQLVIILFQCVINYGCLVSWLKAQHRSSVTIKVLWKHQSTPVSLYQKAQCNQLPCSKRSCSSRHIGSDKGRYTDKPCGFIYKGTPIQSPAQASWLHPLQSMICPRFPAINGDGVGTSCTVLPWGLQAGTYYKTRKVYNNIAAQLQKNSKPGTISYNPCQA
jgi:hypothetical protein